MSAGEERRLEGAGLVVDAYGREPEKSNGRAPEGCAECGASPERLRGVLGGREVCMVCGAYQERPE